MTLDIPESYAETMDILRYADVLHTLRFPVPTSAPALIAAVSSRLLDTGDGEAAAVVDGLTFALKRIACLLETHGGHATPMPDEAYRLAMSLTITD